MKVFNVDTMMLAPLFFFELFVGIPIQGTSRALQDP
jgi:hypothetical protein